ncbi:MAG: hypothetical protein WCT53_06025 [Candidatus Gracilibacteria bacterium]
MPNDNPFVTPDPFPSPYSEEPTPKEEIGKSQPKKTINDKELWKQFGEEKEDDVDVVEAPYEEEKIDETAIYKKDSPMEDFEVSGAVKKACIVTLVVSGIFLVVAFGIWYFSKNNFGTLWNNIVGAEIKSEMIIAKDGGKVSFEGAEVIIPADALAEDTKIEIEKVKEGTVTDLFYFKPHGLKFLKPVTVVIPYKESGLKEGETPYNIKLNYWLGEQEGEESMLNYSVDTEAKTLSAQVIQF